MTTNRNLTDKQKGAIIFALYKARTVYVVGQKTQGGSIDFVTRVPTSKVAKETLELLKDVLVIDDSSDPIPDFNVTVIQEFIRERLSHFGIPEDIIAKYSSTKFFTSEETFRETVTDLKSDWESQERLKIFEKGDKSFEEHERTLQEAEDASSLKGFIDVLKTFQQGSNDPSDQDGSEGELIQHGLNESQEKLDDIDIDIAALALDGQFSRGIGQETLHTRENPIGVTAGNQGGNLMQDAKGGPADRLLHTMVEKAQPFAVDNFDDAINQAANRFLQNNSSEMTPKTRGNSANGMETENPSDKVVKALVNRPRNVPFEQPGGRSMNTGFNDIGLEAARPDRLKFPTNDPKGVSGASPSVRNDKSSESIQRFLELDENQLRREYSHSAPIRSKKKGPTRGGRKQFSI